MIEGNKAKGDSFEKLALAYFRTDPKFQNIKNVWHQRDIPHDVRSHLGLPTNDIGIDILLESVDGEYYPVQCKFHSDPNRAVGWKEASTFIGILNSNENFKAGYLSSNAFEVSSNYDKAISGKPIVRLLGSIWDTVDPDPTAKTRTALVPLKPRPHQEKAINDAIEYFVKEGNSRGKLIFPCGAGKSLTGFWITQKLDAKSILVAVPSLALVKQTLEVYLREIAATQKNARWLCVCSDKEIGSTDEVKIHTSDLGVPCTTDPNEIRNWLQRPGEQQQIVFTTYQSGRLVADIAREENIAFDLAILDEAHKTVGSTGKLFSYLLFDQNIEIRKRIFMTATERFYSGTKDDIVSMDDVDVYGEVFTQMTFKEAINLQLLTDYKVITIDVAKKEIADFIRENKLVELDSKWGTETEARSLAAMIALRKAMKALPIRNAVSFHSSIAKAERNSKLQGHITATYSLPPIASYTVSGKMSTGYRDRIINEFAQAKGALVTNARCLTEGVDVPNIDCIVFADPRKSRIDIVQALGRALRRKEGKDWGYVILPVVYDGDTHEIDNDNFNEIVSIVRGLAANDERIIDQFKDKNSLEKSGGGQLTEEQFMFLTDTLDESEFEGQLGIKLWEGLSKFNWLSFDAAKKRVASFNFRGQKEFYRYTRINPIPQVPRTPHRVYDKYWTTWGDFLGTGSISNSLKKFWTFNEAKQFIQKFNLKSKNKYDLFLKEYKHSHSLPSAPHHAYKNEGWNGYGDFLGNGNIAPFNLKFIPLDELKFIVKGLHLRSQKDWYSYWKKNIRPQHIPNNPSQTYKNSGWTNWADFFGTDNNKFVEYLPFNEALNFVRDLNLKNTLEWREYSKLKRPVNIPSNPHIVYKDKGWINYSHWLGSELKIQKFEITYEKAVRIVSKYPEIKSGSKYKKLWNKNFELQSKMPKHPELKFKGQGWVSWDVFLNLSRFNVLNQLDFEDARHLAHSYGAKSRKEWFAMFDAGIIDRRLPKNPHLKYSKVDGWVNMADWLGHQNIFGKRNFRSFQDARSWAQASSAMSFRDWTLLKDSEEFPCDIPHSPQTVYKSEGWKGWKDFLGNDKKK
jgi:superfamily II DNA or RNA helicase